jgi:hypothetical protein
MRKATTLICLETAKEDLYLLGITGITNCTFYYALGHIVR